MRISQSQSILNGYIKMSKIPNSQLVECERKCKPHLEHFDKCIMLQNSFANVLAQLCVKPSFSACRGISNQAVEFALFYGIFIFSRNFAEFEKWTVISTYDHWLDDVNITNHALFVSQKKMKLNCVKLCVLVIAIATRHNWHNATWQTALKKKRIGILLHVASII